MGRVVLDTGVLVDAFRLELDLAEIVGDHDVALPAIVVAEFLNGAQRARDQERANRQQAFLAAVTDRVPQIAYDHRITGTHAALLTWTQAAGEARGPHDLMIAATARATDRVVLTRDAAARFDQLPGVQARLV